MSSSMYIGLGILALSGTIFFMNFILKKFDEINSKKEKRHPDEDEEIRGKK